jgi:hypothetical protein
LWWDGQHALLQQNYELRENAVDAHQQLLRREGEVQQLAKEVRWHSTAQHSTAQHSTAQHSAAQRSAAQHSTTLR